MSGPLARHSPFEGEGGAHVRKTVARERTRREESADQFGRDKGIDLVDQLAVQQRAEDTTPPFDKDVGATAAS